LWRIQGTCNIGDLSAPTTSPAVCNGQPRTADKMIHLQIHYDDIMQGVLLTWIGDGIDTKHYKGPFTPFDPQPDKQEQEDFLDYSTEIEPEQRDEDLPIFGVSFAEDITNYFVATKSSCENDSLIMFYSYVNRTLQYKTDMRFPSGHLKLKEARDSKWIWRQDEAPPLTCCLYYNDGAVGYDYLNRDNLLSLRGFSYYNYSWGYIILGADKILSFFTYLCLRTGNDWDTSIFNTNPYSVPYRYDRVTWPAFAKRLFQLKDTEGAEKTLMKIIDTYWSYHDQIKYQYYTRQRTHNYDVVRYWLNNNFIPYVHYTEDHYLSYMVGSEYQNLVVPLKESCIIKELSVCFCHNNTNVHVTNMNTRAFSSVSDFNKFKTIAAHDQPWSGIHLYALNSVNTCGTCIASQRHVQYFIGDTTWFLYLEPKLHEFVDDMDIDGLPKELKIRDSFSDNTFATFDLGYVSFVKFGDTTKHYPTKYDEDIEKNGLTHYVSMQNLWGTWYYYDSKLAGGFLYKVDNPLNDAIKEFRLAFAAAVYFRR